MLVFFCLYVTFPSLFFVLVLLTLINRYVTSTKEWFLKSKGKLSNQCNTCRCCMFGVSIYLYGCFSLLAPVCAACVCVCILSNQITSKTPCNPCQTSVSLMPCSLKHTKGRLGGFGEHVTQYKGSLSNKGLGTLC